MTHQPLLLTKRMSRDGRDSKTTRMCEIGKVTFHFLNLFISWQEKFRAGMIMFALRYTCQLDPQIPQPSWYGCLWLFWISTLQIPYLSYLISQRLNLIHIVETRLTLHMRFIDMIGYFSQVKQTFHHGICLLMRRSNCSAPIPPPRAAPGSEKICVW